MWDDHAASKTVLPEDKDVRHEWTHTHTSDAGIAGCWSPARLLVFFISQHLEAGLVSYCSGLCFTFIQGHFSADQLLTVTRRLLKSIEIIGFRIRQQYSRIKAVVFPAVYLSGVLTCVSLLENWPATWDEQRIFSGSVFFQSRISECTVRKCDRGDDALLRSQLRHRGWGCVYMNTFTFTCWWFTQCRSTENPSQDVNAVSLAATSLPNFPDTICFILKF